MGQSGHRCTQRIAGTPFNIYADIELRNGLRLGNSRDYIQIVRLTIQRKL